MKRALVALAVLVGAAALGFVLLQGDVPETLPSVAVDIRGTEVGQVTRIALTLTAGPGGLSAGRTLRVGFPHWVYGSKGVRPPPRVDRLGWGRWYFVELTPELAPGASHVINLQPFRLPQTAGDGFRPLVFLDWEQLPTEPVALQAGKAEGLSVIAPSMWTQGEEFAVHRRLVDAFGNVLEVTREDKEPLSGEGIVPFSVSLDGPDGHFAGRSHPSLFVDDAPPRVAWLDLHGHSGLSDGRGTPEEYFRKARHESLLDGVALSDHDWQLDDAEMKQLLAATEAAYEPGAFVTIPALEINVNGHEVAYFLDSARLAGVAQGSSGGARTIHDETDRGLDTAKVPDVLADYGDADILVATHTSLARGMGTAYPLERPLPGYHLFEVYSAHGSSECAGCPRRVAGEDGDPDTATLWDALDTGHALTLIAAGDGHDGRPGDPAWGAVRGGLTAVEVDELTRESVAEALLLGRSWATTGERTILQSRWTDDGVRVRFVSEEPAQALEVIGDRRVIARLDAPQPGVWLDIPLEPTEWRYVRLLLPNGARAWAGAHRP